MSMPPLQIYLVTRLMFVLPTLYKLLTWFSAASQTSNLTFATNYLKMLDICTGLSITALLAEVRSSNKYGNKLYPLVQR